MIKRQNCPKVVNFSQKLPKSWSILCADFIWKLLMVLKEISAEKSFSLCLCNEVSSASKVPVFRLPNWKNHRAQYSRTLISYQGEVTTLEN